MSAVPSVIEVARAVEVAARLTGEDARAVMMGRPALRARAYAVEALFVLFLDSAPATLLRLAGAPLPEHEAACVARAMNAATWSPAIVLAVIVALRPPSPTGRGPPDDTCLATGDGMPSAPSPPGSRFRRVVVWDAPAGTDVTAQLLGDPTPARSASRPHPSDETAHDTSLQARRRHHG